MDLKCPVLLAVSRYAMCLKEENVAFIGQLVLRTKH